VQPAKTHTRTCAESDELAPGSSSCSEESFVSRLTALSRGPLGGMWQRRLHTRRKPYVELLALKQNAATSTSADFTKRVASEWTRRADGLENPALEGGSRSPDASQGPVKDPGSAGVCT
jgi:hypothetical protein